MYSNIRKVRIAYLMPTLRTFLVALQPPCVTCTIFFSVFIKSISRIAAVQKFITMLDVVVALKRADWVYLMWVAKVRSYPPKPYKVRPCLFRA